jgi:hypothetical protein
MEQEELIARLEKKLGITPVEVIRWFGAKTPEGILVLMVAFCVMSIGLWILSYALHNLGIV